MSWNAKKIKCFAACLTGEVESASLEIPTGIILESFEVVKEELNLHKADSLLTARLRISAISSVHNCNNPSNRSLTSLFKFSFVQNLETN